VAFPESIELHHHRHDLRPVGPWVFIFVLASMTAITCFIMCAGPRPQCARSGSPFRDDGRLRDLGDSFHRELAFSPGIPHALQYPAPGSVDCAILLPARDSRSQLGADHDWHMGWAAHRRGARQRCTTSAWQRSRFRDGSSGIPPGGGVDRARRGSSVRQRWRLTAQRPGGDGGSSARCC